MFESLSNIDLSGITGNISYQYSNMFSDVGSLVISIVGAIAILWMLITFLPMYLEMLFPMSRRYRELLSNMYVAGKVKMIAKADGIDLHNELKEFASFMKKTNLDLKSIDKVVETELNEQIARDFEKHLELEKKAK